MISRLAKGVLPPNTSIHKDALLALSKSCTVFVNFLASNSNEYAQIAGKKTIQPADVIAALKENEFEHFIPRLEAELKSKPIILSPSLHLSHLHFNVSTSPTFSFITVHLSSSPSFLVSLLSWNIPCSSRFRHEY
ncbi:hypothetical protein D6C85_04135 [Aureobasidium pullulans]|uniref:DNA polymerase epsilon subunit D n=1 Tax=Aureobasidium pullulans TaxID=5580 RepID=A0A4S9X4X0_AURPU|nr:hypothetical protein D6C85_04135 [Aureobasidium pullulans]